MPRVLHDLRCGSCGAVERDVFVSTDSAEPASDCGCGGSRSVCYLPPEGRSRRADAFATVTIGGVTYSDRASFDAFRVKYEADNGTPLELVSRSRQGDVAEAEERLTSNLERIRGLGHRGEAWQERATRDLYAAHEIATRRGWK